ncbi:MAG: hypothetical protein RLZ18_776, partial [Actinomycetota bacterium]
LIRANSGVPSASTARVLATLEVSVKLTFVVIENEESAGVVRLLNHPGEVALFVCPVELALNYFDHIFSPYR